MGNTTSVVTVEPNGQSVSVTVTVPSGLAFTAYTTLDGATPYTFPVTVTTRTSFFFDSNHLFDVSLIGAAGENANGSGGIQPINLRSGGTAQVGYVGPVGASGFLTPGMANGTYAKVGFNVSTYGNVTDGTTNPAIALQAAIAACVAAGGGVVDCFDITNTFAAAPTTGSVNLTAGGTWTYAGQVLLPARAITTAILTVELRGKIPPNSFPSTPAGGFDVAAATSGTILKTTATSGNLIDCIPDPGGFTNIHLVLRNLTIQVPNNPQVGGVNGQVLAAFETNGVLVEPAVSPGNTASPTGSARGIQFPQNNSQGPNGGDLLSVRGFPVGVTWTEHVHLNHLCTQMNGVNVYIRAGFHPSRVERWLSTWSPSNLSIDQAGVASPTSFGQIDFEEAPLTGQYSGAWWALTYHVDDIGNFGRVAVDRYHRVRAAFGNVTFPWIKNGGRSVTGKSYLGSNIPVFDSFDRTANVSVLGTADSGHVWTSALGVWGIIGNRAYESDTGTNVHLAYVETGATNGRLECLVTTSPTAARAQAGLLLGYADSSNYLELQIRDLAGGGSLNALVLEKVVAATPSTLGSAMTGAITAATTYHLAVDLLGDTLVVWVDGVRQLTYTMTASEATQFGVMTARGLFLYYGGAGNDDGGSRFNNFKFTPLVAA
jgi:hypothetical protein